MRPVKIQLETYTGDPVEATGAALVRVKYKQQTQRLPIVVVKGNGPSLLRVKLARGNTSWMEANQTQTENL